MAMKDGYNNDRKLNYGKSKTYEDKVRPLQLNLLLLRELLKAMNTYTDAKIEEIYNHLGITSDLFTKFLETGYISDTTYCAVRQNLINAGIKRKYLRRLNARTIKIPELLEIQDAYFDDSYDKIAICKELRGKLHVMFTTTDKKIREIVFVCYRIIHAVAPMNETSLFVAIEALQKISTIKLENKSRESKLYFDLLTEIKNVIKNLKNQYANETILDTKTLMDATTVFLQYILSSEITKEDAQSQECIQMMHEISKTMLFIHQQLSK